jgi:hypothetical protein
VGIERKNTSHRLKVQRAAFPEIVEFTQNCSRDVCKSGLKASQFIADFWTAATAKVPPRNLQKACVRRNHKRLPSDDFVERAKRPGDLPALAKTRVQQSVTWELGAT